MLRIKISNLNSSTSRQSVLLLLSILPLYLLLMMVRVAQCEIEYNTINDDGSYSFRHSNTDIGGYYHSASGTPDNVVRGRYGSRNPATGQVEETIYTAGPRGFRANGPKIHRKMDLAQFPVRPQGNADDPLADPYDDPSYSFSFRTSDQSRSEDNDATGRVRGLYSYIDDEGERHSVRYAAGAGTGFEVSNAVPDNPASVAYAAPLYKAHPQTRGKMSVQRGPNGSYKLIAAGPDQRRAESRAPDGLVRGSYSFLDDKGVQRTVEYVAGAGIGYRVINSKIGTGTHINPSVADFRLSDNDFRLANDFGRGAGSSGPSGGAGGTGGYGGTGGSNGFGGSGGSGGGGGYGGSGGSNGFGGSGGSGFGGGGGSGSGSGSSGGGPSGNRRGGSAGGRGGSGGGRGGSGVGGGGGRGGSGNGGDNGNGGGSYFTSSTEPSGGGDEDATYASGSNNNNRRGPGGAGSSGAGVSGGSDSNRVKSDRMGIAGTRNRGHTRYDASGSAIGGGASSNRNRGGAGSSSGSRGGGGSGGGNRRGGSGGGGGGGGYLYDPPSASHNNNNYDLNDDEAASGLPPLITANRHILEIDRDRDWAERHRDSTIIRNVGKWYIGLPPGQSVRAHVQNIDLLPAGGRRVQSPSEALRRDEIADYVAASNERQR